MLSIIVPIYNIESFLSQCIESLIAQRNDDIEIILVDDGSKDKCPEICDSYALKDNRIHVIHKKNGGLVSARIAGLNSSRGDYIIFVDGDDWIDEKCVQIIMGAIRKYNDPDLICFGAVYVTKEGNHKYPISMPCGYYDIKRINEKIYPMLIENEFGKYFDASIWGKVFKRDQLEKCYENMSEKITLGEDAAITRPYLLNCTSLIILPECLYYYNRTNQSSMTSALKPIRWENTWLIREILVKSFGYNDTWKNQINRNTVHNLFITSVSQFNSQESFLLISKDIRQNLRTKMLPEICNNTKYKKFINRAVVWTIRYRLTFVMYLYWRLIK